MQLSVHFSLEELTASEYAARHGIDNTPPAAVVENLRKTATGMEKVRGILDALPIHVNSGYRCADLNRAIGGVPTSAHCDGWAVDFVCPRFGSTYLVACAIRDARPPLRFDQLILEYGWVHISFAPTMRGELLTIKGPGRPYERGLLP